MKQLLITIIIACLYNVPLQAQNIINPLKYRPDSTALTMEQYVNSHTLEEMNNDTVVLWNPYVTISYYYRNSRHYELLGHLYATAEFQSYKDGKWLVNENYIVYARSDSSRFVLTDGTYKGISSIVKSDLYDSHLGNWITYRKETFKVTAQKGRLGSIFVKFQLLSNPQYFTEE